jgi:membrane protease YdiL (CAAX protease family)
MEMKTSISLVNKKTHNIVAWLLMVGLLLLRFPIQTGIALFALPGWLEPVYYIGTYFLTACLIWWERERLTDFNIDKLALGIIILFGPMLTLVLKIWKASNNPLTFPNLPSISFWLISIGLFLALWMSHTPLPKLTIKSFGWFGFGIVVALLIALIMGYVESFKISQVQLPRNANILWLFTNNLPSVFIFQLGLAAVAEEPLFRGFLWGYLQKAGWNNIWIWIFQAVLFMLGHLYFIQKAPLSFWLIVPFTGLVCGALVWRSKTISSSLAAHATLNALTGLVFSR